MVLRSTLTRTQSARKTHEHTWHMWHTRSCCDRVIRLGELDPVQAGVQAAVGQQLGVAADLGDAAGLQYHDAVSAFDGGKAMRHDEGCATAHQPLQRYLDEALGLRIQRR